MQDYSKWYVFSCQPKPIQMDKGYSPMPPFKSFNTEEEAWRFISDREVNKLHKIYPTKHEIRGMAITEDYYYRNKLKEALDEFYKDSDPTFQKINKVLATSLLEYSDKKVTQSEEMVEIPPKDIVDANMIKRGFLKPKMRPKTISIEYKPRIKE